MNILVTGGAGYIGSHTCVELLQEGHTVIVVDNLSNSSLSNLKKVSYITKKKLYIEGKKGNPDNFIFERVDIREDTKLRAIFSKYKIDCVIHFAGLKAVGESVEKPLEYYDNNVIGSINLYRVMESFNVKKIVFSSSATVYGDPYKTPIKESFPVSTTNPYGQSKLINENILRDIYTSDNNWNIVLLRYFNPVGAHNSGLIGESPNGVPNNLMPYICKVATGELKKLFIFGGDYPTSDGTGIRDYIHVVDLSKGHVSAINYISTNIKKDVLTVNLGTGKGCSVLEMVNSFEHASGVKIPYSIVERRLGDIAECYADTSYAKKVLDWEAELSIEDMCKDTWRWVKNND